MDMFYWSIFWIYCRIFRNLVFRYFTPWDEYFLNSIVFDIWYIACNAEVLGDLADKNSQAPFHVLEEGLQEDEELILAIVNRPAVKVSPTGGLESSSRTKSALPSKSVSFSVFTHQTLDS